MEGINGLMKKTAKKMKKTAKKWKRGAGKAIKQMEAGNEMRPGQLKRMKRAAKRMRNQMQDPRERKRKKELICEAAKSLRDRIDGNLDMKLRTDLALEEKERFPGDGGEVRGVSLQEWYQQERQIKITEVKILNRQGAKAMGKEMGTYLTIEAHGIEKKGKEMEGKLAEELAVQIRKLSGKGSDWEEETLPEHILVVGLGNLYVTPDSLGPRVLQHLQVTRHLDGQYGEGFLKKHGMASISGIAPGVMAQTGMETAEILKGVVAETKPELMIAIDALAARSVHRLGCTIQLSDTGIRPGSGVGNHRNGLTKETLGIPVLAIGVPTVVGAAAIVQDTIEAMVKALEMGKNTKGTGQYLSGLNPEEQYALIRELLEPEFGPMFVTPPDIEERVEQLGSVIAEAIELAF